MELPPRYRAVLLHVARYRLTLRETVGRLMLPDDDRPPRQQMDDRRTQGGNVLARLHGYGLLNHHHHKSTEYPPFPGNVPYYTLTPAGAKLAGVPIDRAEEAGKRAMSADALEPHLAALWFCCMNRHQRYRVEPDELASLFGKHKFFENVPHCVAQDDDAHRIYRVYPPSTHIPRIIEQAKKHLADTRAKQPLGDWVGDRSYGFAILGAEPSVCSDITAALRQSGLADEAAFKVALGPTPAALRDALRNYEQGQ